MRSVQFESIKGAQEKVENIFYDQKNVSVYFKTSSGSAKAVRSKVQASSMRATLEQFDKKVDGIIDPDTKLLVRLFDKV